MLLRELEERLQHALPALVARLRRRRGQPHVLGGGWAWRVEEQILGGVQGRKALQPADKQRHAVAAAALVVAAPFAVNAATGGELFNRIWGNEGKENIESHVIFVNEVKTGRDGETYETHYEITYPAVEYVEADPELAERLIGNRMTTEPVSFTVGDNTFTIESVVHDGMSVIVSYSIENPNGVDCLSFSSLDNEAEGATDNPDSDTLFGFLEAHGKTWVDIERSTNTKVYCIDYMIEEDGTYGPSLEDQLTMYAEQAIMSRRDLEKYLEENRDNLAPDGSDWDTFVKDEKELKIPVAAELDTKSFVNSSGDQIVVSPISMTFNPTSSVLTTDLEALGAPDCYDGNRWVTITYKDGSEYLVYNGTIDNRAYICGNSEGHGYTALFNRLVDIDNIAKITVYGIEFTPA